MGDSKDNPYASPTHSQDIGVRGKETTFRRAGRWVVFGVSILLLPFFVAFWGVVLNEVVFADDVSLAPVAFGIPVGATLSVFLLATAIAREKQNRYHWMSTIAYVLVVLEAVSIPCARLLYAAT